MRSNRRPVTNFEIAYRMQLKRSYRKIKKKWRISREEVTILLYMDFKKNGMRLRTVKAARSMMKSSWNKF